MLITQPHPLWSMPRSSFISMEAKVMHVRSRNVITLSTTRSTKIMFFLLMMSGVFLSGAFPVRTIAAFAAFFAIRHGACCGGVYVC